MNELAPMLAPELNGKPFASIKALRDAATKAVDQVEKRLKENKELPIIEVLYSLKCLRHAGRDSTKFLENWRPEGAFALKECQKLLAYLGSEYGKESSIYYRLKDRTIEVFPLLKL